MFTGKSNHRKCWRMASEMEKEVRACFPELPDWAGLAWIVDPRWNYRAWRVWQKMGARWTERAQRLARALAR